MLLDFFGQRLQQPSDGSLCLAGSLVHGKTPGEQFGNQVDAINPGNGADGQVGLRDFDHGRTADHGDPGIFVDRGQGVLVLGTADVVVADDSNEGKGVLVKGFEQFPKNGSRGKFSAIDV